MIWYFKPGEELSFYLRTNWNMSHFTVAQLFIVIATAIALSYKETILGSVIILITGMIVAYVAHQKAKVHNRPANVHPLVSPGIVFMLTSVFLLGTGLLLHAGKQFSALDWFRYFLVLSCFYLLSIPGHKIDYDPKLNFATRGA